MRRGISWIFAAFLTVGVLSTPAPSQDDPPQANRKLVSKVAPSYPDLARRTNVRGTVKLIVVVAPDGKVTSTEVVGGNPVLVQAAVDAVRKWRYESAPQQTHGVVELRFDTH